MTSKIFTAIVLSAAMALPAAHAQLATDADYPRYDPPANVRDGYTADDLLNAEVRGLAGEKIGDIEDLIIGPDGKLRRLVVSVNEGLFGTGGRRLAVNWADTQVRRSGDSIDYVSVPVTKQNVELFGIFKNKPKAVEGKPREWRATELLGDYVSLKDISDYGSITDLMFDRSGQLQAIAAAPDRRGAVPWVYSRFDDDGWEPGDNYYVIPYSQSQLAEVMPKQMQRSADKSAGSARTETDSIEGDEGMKKQSDKN